MFLISCISANSYSHQLPVPQFVIVKFPVTAVSFGSCSLLNHSRSPTDPGLGHDARFMGWRLVEIGYQNAVGD